MPPWLSDRNSIAAVSEAGLVLAIDGAERRVPWAAIESVAAGSASIGDGEIFVLALDIDIDIDENNATRLLAVSETEKIWPELTRMLPIGLPAIDPFERWGAALVDKAGVITLYERPAQGVAPRRP